MVVVREGQKEKKFVSWENRPRSFEFRVTTPLYVLPFSPSSSLLLSFSLYVLLERGFKGHVRAKTFEKSEKTDAQRRYQRRCLEIR